MKPSKTITFTQDASIVNEGRVPRLYKAGETHTLRADQADRWIRRGAAVAADPVATARADMEALKAKTFVVERVAEPVIAPVVAAPDALKTPDMRPGPSPRNSR